jgi:hypothetical protein
MRDYRTYSFWLEDAGEALTPRPSLASSTDVDVAILGGGYSGLWTAYYLLLHEPALRVAVVDKEIAGFGASGRNGGWCSPNFSVTATGLEKRFGAEAARNLLVAMRASVDEVGRVCDQENIDARFHRGGVLTLARGQHQLPGIRSSYAAYQRLGLGDRYRLLSAEEALGRIRVTGVHGALFTPDGASLHPARLVRGLARAVEVRGGVIYERTPVTRFKPGSLTTPGGELRAKRAVVIAGEAYLTRLPNLHRALLPVYSLISLTERYAVGADWLAGWRECLLHTQHGGLSHQDAGWPPPLWQPWRTVRLRLENHRSAGYSRSHGKDDPALGLGVVSVARGRSFHPRVGWASGHASRLDAGRAVQRWFGDRFDYGVHGTRCLHQQPGGSLARGTDHRSANRVGKPSVGTEKLPLLGDGTFAVAGGALYAGRFFAYR